MRSPTGVKQLAKRVGLNSLGYGYSQLVTVLSQLVVVPFFLKYWGVAKYGDWLVLSGLPMMLTLLDIGVTQASANKATALAASGDWEAARKTVHTATLFTVIVGGLAAVCSLAVSAMGDWVAVLGLTTTSGHAAKAALAGMAVYLFVSFACGPVDSWFRVIDRTALGAFLLANRRLVDVAVSVVVLMTGSGIAGLAWALAIGQIVALLVLIAIARYLSPRSVMGVSAAEWQEFRCIVKPAVGFAGFPLAQVLTMQGGVQILNQLAGPAAVVSFTMGRTLMRLIIQVGVVVNNALKPEVSRLQGRGEMELARDFTRRLSILIFGLCGALFAVGTFVGPDVVRLWSHGKVALGSLALAVIGLHALLNVAWFVPASLFIATNRHPAVGGVYFVSAIGSLAGWWLLSSTVSPLTGAALALLVPELAVLLYFGVVLYARGARSEQRAIDA